MQFEQVDKLIEVLAEDITQLVESKRAMYEGEVEEKTKALAELVSARALHSNGRYVKSTNADCDNLIKKDTQKRNMGSYS